MTPLQFAREECANHQPDGSCLGAWINEDLSITRGDPKPRCLLAEGKRCRYFEECVAPMARMVNDPRRATALRDAVTQYYVALDQGQPAKPFAGAGPGSEAPPRGARHTRNPMSDSHPPTRTEIRGLSCPGERSSR